MSSRRSSSAPRSWAARATPSWAASSMRAPTCSHYLEHRLGMARRIGSDLRLHVDCANGSASAVAPEILAAVGRLGRRPTTTSPTGVNINLGCGATVPEALAAIVAERGGDVGFSLDGDADRCVAIDERGEVVDGDQLLGIIALDRLARGALAEDTVVVSILSNGGLARAVGAGRRPRPAHARSATATSSTRCSSPTPASAARRAATSSSASTPPPVTASSPRSRSSTSWLAAAGRSPSWRRPSRSTRRSSAPSVSAPRSGAPIAS